MALRWIEGFELYGTGTGAATQTGVEAGGDEQHRAVSRGLSYARRVRGYVTAEFGCAD